MTLAETEAAYKAALTWAEQLRLERNRLIKEAVHKAVASPLSRESWS